MATIYVSEEKRREKRAVAAGKVREERVCDGTGRKV
jgi:hypothetical protein